MTLTKVFTRFKFRISITIGTVIVEAILILLFPLFIGKAIDAALGKETQGIIYLAVLCFCFLIIGGVRRFYDTRTYALIFRKLAKEITANSTKRKPTKQVAHINLLEEVVQFFENSVPQLTSNIITFVGILIIIFTTNSTVFIGCLVVTLTILGVYRLSSRKILKFNNRYNSEFEKQVTIHISDNEAAKSQHYKRFKHWQIKLSDTETINFSIVWFMQSILLCLSILIIAGQEDTLSYGLIFSSVIYVWQFIENTLILPVYYQELLRLQDITKRLTTIVQTS